MPLDDPLLTKADVANVLRCCERTLERRVQAKEFPPAVKFGKELLWFTSTVRDWLERERAKQHQWLANHPHDAQTPSPRDTAANEPSTASTTKPAPTGRRQSRVKPRPSELESSLSPFSAEELAAAHR